MHEMSKLKWDEKPPPIKYFIELLNRVAKNYIVWGGNYFKLHSYRSLLDCLGKNDLHPNNAARLN
jgi:hypothetical protein